MHWLPVHRPRRCVQLVASLIAALASSEVSASYINIFDRGGEDTAIEGDIRGEIGGGFALNGTAWDPGSGTSRVGGNPSPGGASWSILRTDVRLHGDLASGSGGLTDLDHRAVGRTSDFDGLLAAPGREVEMVSQVLDVWAENSGFSNLGRVTDGNTAIGAPGFLAHIGDIRVGVFEIVPLFDLAHTFRPSTGGQVSSGGSAGGDMHIDRARIWTDDPDDTNPPNSLDYDLYTVLLHEMGHALGLAHSAAPASVMFASYTGGRRELSGDDLLGIQAIYGTPVPEPGTLLCVCGGLVGISLHRRRRPRLRR